MVQWQIYTRVGHLFQDRFKSEPVENNEYLFMVLRYIHQNPVKAGISDTLMYKWSSYANYAKDKSDEFVDTEVILSMVKKSALIQFHQEINDDKCLDIAEVRYRLTDEQAIRVIKKLSHCSALTEIQGIEVSKRNKLLKKFKEKGISIRQISRLTGISKGIIERT